MTNPVFLHPSLEGDVVVLDGPEGRHAGTVRRVQVGELLDLVDGRGTRCTGRVTAAAKDAVTVQVLRRVDEPVPSPRITVVQAIAKGDRGERAVELLTEVGVDVIVPWSASRCVVQWNDERGAKALERWRSTAREAGKQSRRAWFPTVTEAVPTAALLDISGTVLVLHEAATTRLSDVALVHLGGASSGPATTTDADKTAAIVLVVGPEGGITDAELALLTAAGATAVRLGPSVLRTSSAGAVAAAVVSSRTGRW